MKKILVWSVIMILFLGLGGISYATSKSPSNGLIIEVVDFEDLPKDIKEDINESIRTGSFTPSFDKKAWEVDLKGSKKEVTPKDEKRTRVPGDDFIYRFDKYDAEYVKRNWEYKPVETVRITNNRDYSITGKYTQRETVSKKGYIEGYAEGSVEVDAFISEVEVKMGVSAGYSREWTKGTEYGVEFDVPANDVVYVTNWAVGINSNGAWR